MVERYSFDLGLEGEGVWPCKFGAWVGWNDYAALLAENERLKSEAGYTAADVATAAADGFLDGVRSVDMEQFREAVVVARTYYAEMAGDIYDPAHNYVADCDHLLALIDAHKGE